MCVCDGQFKYMDATTAVSWFPPSPALWFTFVSIYEKQDSLGNCVKCIRIKLLNEH